MLPAGQTSELGSEIEVENTRGPQRLKTEDGKYIYIDTKVTVRQDANGVYIKDSAKTTLYQYNGAGVFAAPIRTLGTREVGKPWVMNQALTDPNNAGLTSGQLSLINKGPTQEDIEKSLGNLQSSLNKGVVQHSQAVLSAKLDTKSGDPTPKLPGKDNTQQTSAEALGQNTANDPQPDLKGTVPAPEPTPTTYEDSGENREGTRDNFGTYMYPLTLRETNQDILKIDMLKYAPAGLDIKKDRAGLGEIGNDGKERKSIGSVILPIPGGIKDSNKAEWGGNSMNSLEMAAADIAMESIKEGGGGFASAFGKAAATTKGSASKIQEAIASAFTAAAIGKDFQNIMARDTGMIMNPNMELLFNGPSLRPFSFSFLLAPRSKDEAKQVIQIIRFFKQGMAPIRSQANLFLKSPHTFQLQYKHRGAEHPYLNKFKECALKSCDINYTPQNNYSTYDDGVMTAYSMTLSFTELEPVYNDDYGKENIDGKIPAEIGF